MPIEGHVLIRLAARPIELLLHGRRVPAHEGNLIQVGVNVRRIELLVQRLLDNLLGVRQAIKHDERLCQVEIPYRGIRIETQAFTGFGGSLLELSNP